MSTQNPVVFTQGNSQTIKVYNLQDVDNMQFWNAASASANLVDQNGNLTMVQGVILYYQAGSLGNYFGTVTTDFSMPIGDGYKLLVYASQTGAQFYLELPAIVVARTS